MTLENFQNLIREMCDLRKSGNYVPILEADLSGFLFHLVVAKNLCPLRRIHLDTRIIGGDNKNDRFDLVIGDVHLREDGRPAVSPETVIEIKMFPNGFTDQQHRVHFEHVLNDDLRKLGCLRIQTATRVEFIFDEVDYLGGEYKGQTREDVILTKRAEVAEAVGIVFPRKIHGDWQVSVK